MARKEVDSIPIAYKETQMATTEIVTRTDDGRSTDLDTLYLLGGAALVIVGAGLVLSNPTVRKYMSQIGIGDIASAAIPDIERYFRLRAM
jgi:hypothetical protein